MKAIPGEMEGIALATGERPVMSEPPAMKATKKLIRYVTDALDGLDETARADWVLNFAERYAGQYAAPVLTMDGSGPVCSVCQGSMPWPLCGHQHLSLVLDEDDDEDDVEDDVEAAR